MTKKEHDKIVKGYIAVIKNKDNKLEESIKIADSLEKEVVELARECGRYSKTIEDQITEIDRLQCLYDEYYIKYAEQGDILAEAHKKVGLLKIQVSEEQIKYNNAVEVFADIIKELN